MATPRYRKADPLPGWPGPGGAIGFLGRLDEPRKIQAFLNSIPCNHEIGGETVLSVREVLRQRRAHCIEGAMVAAAAMWVNGIRPLVLHLDCWEGVEEFYVAISINWPNLVMLKISFRCSFKLISLS